MSVGSSSTVDVDGDGAAGHDHDVDHLVRRRHELLARLERTDGGLVGRVTPAQRGLARGLDSIDARLQEVGEDELQGARHRDDEHLHQVEDGQQDLAP